MTADRERMVIAAFIAFAVLAGGNAVGIRFTNRELDPLWGAGLRFSLAAARPCCWWSWWCCGRRCRVDAP